MPNRSTDSLFQLIKSLEKGEKRNFKLYVNRNGSAEGLKSVLLFDALDKMEQYDEPLLLKKQPSIQKAQLSNLKAQLYRQILSSLRLIPDQGNIDMVLHEQLDHARILYNKGLYLQSLKVLDKLKTIALNYEQRTYLQQALFFEKNIEALYITRSMRDRADQLSTQSEEVTEALNRTSHLSNLALQLYSWYIKHGHCRNRRDEMEAQEFFNQRIRYCEAECSGFYDRLYLYQCYCWYAFIRQDFLQYYRHAQKWVWLFDEYPQMLETEPGLYIKGMHNLMGAHFDLGNHSKLKQELELFDAFRNSRLVQQCINNQIQCFVYSYISRINQHFLEGSFTEGLQLVPEIEQQLLQYDPFLDQHRVLIFYYKIACLYFGSGDFESAIEYLNRIINWKVDLRTDLQCYSRLLHLIAHYELGNEQILDHLIRSVYRFMAKMENLSEVEEAVFRFVRRSFSVTVRHIRPELEALLLRLRELEHDRYETRAFLYLDIISWIESKLERTPVQEILKRKFATQRLRH